MEYILNQWWNDQHWENGIFNLIRKGKVGTWKISGKIKKRFDTFNDNLEKLTKLNDAPWVFTAKNGQ